MRWKPITNDLKPPRIRRPELTWTSCSAAIATLSSRHHLQTGSSLHLSVLEKWQSPEQITSFRSSINIRTRVTSLPPTHHQIHLPYDRMFHFQTAKLSVHLVRGVGDFKQSPRRSHSFLATAKQSTRTSHTTCWYDSYTTLAMSGHSQSCIMSHINKSRLDINSTGSYLYQLCRFGFYRQFEDWKEWRCILWRMEKASDS